MTRKLATWFVFVGVLLVAPASAFRSSDQAPVSPRSMDLPDVLAWKSLAAPVLADDGRWLAYRVSPVQGDSEVVVRATTGDKEYRFPIGEVPPATGGPGESPASAAAQFSAEGRFAAFAVFQSRQEAARLKTQQKPLHNKLRLLDLTSGLDITIENVRRFAFAGDRAGWIAIHKDPPDGAPGQRDKDKPKGSDLLLRDLATGRELNIGNVGEFAFDKSGRWLAWTVDAADQGGNGVALRNMESGVVLPLDSDKASYEKLAWADAGGALAVLKGVDDKAYADRLYSVVGFKNLAAATPDRVVFDPKAAGGFPPDMSVSPDQAPSWTEALSDLIFGIRSVKKKPADAKPADQAAEAKDVKDAPDAGKSGGAAPSDDKPDLVLWHWKDARLQSQQQVEEDRDKKFSFLCAYNVERRAFLRLADDNLREVQRPDHGVWAVGLDSRAYDLAGSLDGRRYQDVYAVNLATGQRTLAVKRARWYSSLSPAGNAFLYYEDGNYFAYDMAAGKAVNLTAGVPASFVNTDDDHNVVKPPVPAMGWAKGGASVLLSDGWDVWNVLVAGGVATNLTGNGRKDGIRYRSRLRLDPDEKGIDLDVPQYIDMYGERTKTRGVARLVPGKPGAEVLAWDAASYGRLMKAKKADVYVYTRETTIDPPEAFVADATLKGGRRLTDFGAQRAPFQWSPGGMLVEYTSARGDKLQGALYLPAGYEKGKTYPTIVYIYEKLSQDLNRFAAPTANGFNRTVYTSNGYAVLMPDITYKVNDPGNSAVWCVLPALKAAVATGVVDSKRVGLHGHSWGGYQTAFLVTQTDAFAAAVAGAPLTDMVSMYSLIYKNSGSANQPIFESSQGRFLGGYWDNWEAYVRNSPVAFARNVKTPLVLLHNDKDGAVDFTQGVEYFNTLRRLGKPVVLLEYLGENHGLRKPANQQDYTVRMKEFFGHYLQGRSAPAWLTDGIPRLEMDEHLKERAAERTVKAPVAKK